MFSQGGQQLRRRFAILAGPDMKRPVGKIDASVSLASPRRECLGGAAGRTCQRREVGRRR